MEMIENNDLRSKNYNIPELKCPAKPLSLATTCGISRYYE